MEWDRRERGGWGEWDGRQGEGAESGGEDSGAVRMGVGEWN